MADFEELTKKVQEVASAAAEKAQAVAAAAGEKVQDAVDSVKLSAAILSEQRNIDKKYRVIGEWYVAEVEEEVPDAVADIIAAIRASKEKIAELEALRSSKGCEEESAPAEERICPNCGAAAASRYCPDCGTQLRE